MICSRSACQVELKQPYYKIYNEPSMVDGCRNYCFSCGHRIMSYNLTLPEGQRMKYEVVRNHGTMKISKVTYETTGHYKTPVLRIWGVWAGNKHPSPMRRIMDEELDDAEFLCLTTGGRTFVSSIMSAPQLGLYVDDVAGKICVPINDLKELYLIEATKE